MIQFKVNGQELEKVQPTIASNSNDYLTASFQFSSDWEGCSKVATFTLKDKVFRILLVDDSITEDMHLDLTEGVWEVGVTGTLGNKIITTVPALLKVHRNAPKDGVPFPIDPPSLGQQILNKATEAEAIAQSVRQDADSGKFNGKTPVKGVDYFTEADKREFTKEVEESLKPTLDLKADKTYVDEELVKKTDKLELVPIVEKNEEQDSLITQLKKTIAELKYKLDLFIDWANNIIYKLITDSNRGDKVIPNGAHFMDVLELGGMGRKCKNLFNPINTLRSDGKYYQYNGTYEVVDDEFIINARGNDFYIGSFGSVLNEDYILIKAEANKHYNVSLYGDFDKCVGQFVYIDTDGTLKSLNSMFSIDAINTTIAPNNTAYLSIRPGIANSVSGETYRGKVMVNEGSTPLPYEPYTPNLIDAKVNDVEIRGRNLCNISSIVSSTGGSASGFMFGGEEITNFVKSLKSGTYSVKYEVSGEGGTKGGSFGRIALLLNGTTQTPSFTLTITDENRPNITNVALYGYYPYITNTITKIQFELGTTPHDYLPYHEPTHHSIPQSILNLPNYGIGVNDVYNYIDFVNKKYVQKAFEHIFDGNEGWTLFNNGNFNIFYTDFFDGKVKPQTTNFIINAKANVGSGARPYFVFAHSTGTRLHLYCNYGWNGINDMATFKAFINGKTICYEGNAPIETDIDFELNDISVESGGQILFNYPNKDTYNIDVPNTEEYVIKINEVI